MSTTPATNKFAKAAPVVEKSKYELAAEASQQADGKIRSEGTYIGVLKEIRFGNHKTSKAEYFAVETTLVSAPEGSGHSPGDVITAHFEMVGQFPSYYFSAMQTVAAKITACPASMKVPSNIIEDIFEKNLWAGMPLIIRAELRPRSKVKPDEMIMASSIVRRLTSKEALEHGLEDAAKRLAPGGDWE